MPPNVLVFITDQQSADAISCAGNRDLHTPAMDHLAATGVRFEHAFCTYPVCIPSRESMLTGRMPLALGYRQWGDPIAPEFREQELGHLFREAGYECVYGGKLHTPGRDPEPHGFRCISPMGDTILAQSCVDYLQGRGDQPFLMVASFDNPHNICEWARQQPLPWGDVPDAPTEECPSLPANHGIPPYEPQPIRLIQRRAPHVYPGMDYSPDQWRHFLHAYYRLVEKADEGIGRILAALREHGLEDDTLVVFTSDHGDGHGAHRWNQKSLLYEECVNIPFIISYPGHTRAGAVESGLTSNGLDLLPTLCDYAGIEAPQGLPGASLRPLLEGEPQERRESLVVEAWPFQGDPSKTLGRLVCTDRYRYIIYSWGLYREQLFDMVADPGQMVNLAVNRRYAAVLEDHRRILRDYCQETGDEFARYVPRDTR
jgi:arylsulfatase A-like enzyme